MPRRNRSVRSPLRVQRSADGLFYLVRRQGAAFGPYDSAELAQNVNRALTRGV